MNSDFFSLIRIRTSLPSGMMLIGKIRSWTASHSNQLTKVRSISPNFCIMEQQSGPGGWVKPFAQSSPKPGQMRLWTYQSVAHGADMLLFFRWRTATFGTEIYWHGINDYHNQPNRRVAEAEIISRELGTNRGEPLSDLVRCGGRHLARL